MDLFDLRRHLRSRLPDALAELRAKAAEKAPGAGEVRSGLTVFNADASDGDTAVVRIYDEVSWWGVTAAEVVQELDGVTAPKIRVEINSPGGDVFDGVAIYNALRNHPAHVTTRIDGIAASIASVIVQAGDTRQIMSAGQMMIHNAWGFTIGDHRDHEEMAGLLAQQDNVIAGIYASRSGRDRDEFRELMAAETWLTDQAAVDAGLADELVEPDRKEPPADRMPAPAPAASTPPVPEPVPVVAPVAGDTGGTIPVERRLLLARHDLT